VEYLILVKQLDYSILLDVISCTTGYGPRRDIPGRYGRLLFDGDERKYEQWEIKFLGYMRLQKLRDTIVASDEDEVSDDKNAEAFAELI
jgi:hypothetical protein